MQTFWSLIISFGIIGVGAYGGGLVTVPLMQHELVGRGLLTVEEMSKIVAIAQMTPGPIAVNGATFVGYRAANIPGALVATAVVVLPGLLALTVALLFRDKMPTNDRSLRVRRGLRAGVLSLLLFAAWSYGRGVVTGPVELLIAAGAFLILTVFQGKVHPLAIIAGSGLLGVFIF